MCQIKYIYKDPLWLLSCKLLWSPVEYRILFFISDILSSKVIVITDEAYEYSNRPFCFVEHRPSALFLGTLFFN